ncbi:hypothetical protein ALI22I_29065 [Saccharothrix sp. ALI-22-I]|uniref:hypothetical protein n=1 Tax=Saccharothrix sp. ALI-22-I TaxID=1933778 RepID=UPI00097C2510|nr:hypothetical protein [Saccharothrix sp. ALI-22-I]ONI84602.1 hypothetical protein ALI22I_29065 [Saccharothrix sp. ALI-22-I]
MRGWINDGISPIERVAAAYAGPNPVVWEWYWPARLTVDLDVAAPSSNTFTHRVTPFLDRLVQGRAR